MWDLALSENGDLMFSPTRDLLGTTADELTKQRILVRCRIPRGSWAYDATGTLGSRLAASSRNPHASQLQQAPALVREALAPMDDIQIEDVQVSTDENNRLMVAVNFKSIISVDDQETADAVDESMPSVDAIMTI
jgi:hypothetical protein